MPGFDQTGPAGTGPMTGGARGLCHPANAGYNLRFPEGFGRGGRLGLRRGFRGGFGPDRGRGRAFERGNGWYPGAARPTHSPDTVNEMEMLKAQAGFIQRSLDTITKRMNELDQESFGSS